MKVDEFVKHCDSLIFKSVNLSKALSIIERQRAALNDIAHVGEYESSQRAIDALAIEVIP